jgi:hypothetical protein
MRYLRLLRVKLLHHWLPRRHTYRKLVGGAGGT